MATVDCYMRFYVVALTGCYPTGCYFQAVDGNQADWPIQPRLIKLKPGLHLIQVASEVCLGGSGGQCEYWRSISTEKQVKRTELAQMA